jgi:hypothetical protein
MAFVEVVSIYRVFYGPELSKPFRFVSNFFYVDIIKIAILF